MNKNSLLKIFVLLFALSICLIGCGKDKKDDKEKGPELEFSISGDSEIYKGDKGTYTVISNIELDFVFSVDNENLALIDEKGVLLATEVGEVVISAKPSDNKYKDKVETFTVVIKQKDLEFSIVGIENIDEGESFKFTVKSNIEMDFVFSIDNEDLANITADGEFIAFEAGEVVVTATPSDEAFKGDAKSVTVTINKVYMKPNNIDLDGDSSCKIGESVEFTVRISPSGAKQEYYYEVSNSEVGYVENDVFYGLKEGETVITVYHIDGEIKDTINMVVYLYNVNEDIYLYDGVSRVMTSSEYWIGLQDNPNEVLLTIDEIKAMNQEAYKVSNTKLVDILNQPDVLTSSQVKTKINSYSLSNSIKINGSTISSSYRTNLLNNVNVNGVTGDVTVKYGLINEFAALRTFPTMDVATTTNSFDRFQETGLEVGLGCLIYHTSLDGKWYFIQAYNYYGWILKDKVTEVTKSEMVNYVNAKDFVVVTAKDTKVGDTAVRMSTKLPVVNQDDTSYTLMVVEKTGLNIKKVNKSNDFHFGYLPYTKTNILTQIFKLLDDKYRWGDCEFDGHDCSSTMNAVYQCFGFDMPRNTSNQEKLPYTTYNVSSYSDSQKKAILDNLQVGSLVFVSGHVMMYLGKVNNDYYIIHNFNSYGGCNITTSRLIRSGSNTYLNAYTVFLEFK